MTNEEKAKEISDIYMPDTGFTRDDLYDAAMEMAQFILSNQWISVKEALPEDYEDVFVRNEFGKCTSAFLAMGRWHLSYGEIAGDDVLNSKITHWMEIPSLEGGEE